MLVAVQKVYENKTKTGKRYWVAQTSDERLYVWDSKIAERLKAGGTFDVEVDTSGSYPKITKINETPPAAPDHMDELFKSLERLAEALRWSAALKAAIDYVSIADIPKSELDSQKIIELAVRFAEGWKAH